MNCRFCEHPLQHVMVSLGSTPLANAYLTRDQLDLKESSYPLDVYVCEQCFLAQLPEFECPENIFGDYAYFSSFSDSWLRHAERYVTEMISRFGIGKSSHVVEVASNDGYLLQYFVQKGIPVLGIEPAANIAEVAQKKGIPTDVTFFGAETARDLLARGKSADLLLGNNVLAHVPDLNDFVAGLKILLKPDGLITMEFPHLMQLMEQTQFDTIYHEHFSYFSFLSVQNIFAFHGLTIFDVDEIPTHGGSLRIYVQHKEFSGRPISDAVDHLLQREKNAGYATLDHYLGFGEKVEAIKKDFLTFLQQTKKAGKSVAAYGAAAKGNTLFNAFHVTKDDIDFVADRSPYKQNRYLPGNRIPVVDLNVIQEARPDYVVILPWNLKEEIMEQLSYISEWGGTFVIPIPRVHVMT